MKLPIPKAPRALRPFWAVVILLTTVHILGALIIIFTDFFGLETGESFLFFRLYQTPRTDALILIALSLAFWLWLLFFVSRKGLIPATLMIGSLFIALLTFDYIIGIRPGNILYPGGYQKRSISYLELHPYTGWQVPANFHHTGPVPGGGNYKDYDFQSGDRGFFIDFSLDNPPEKLPNEFRIILIGGSGAMGFGAKTNSEMFYRKLETVLNSKLLHRNSKTKVRVINLAMGSSITFQNFIALNLYGHKLKPDLILSYSGANDFSVFTENSKMTDAFYNFMNVNKLVLTLRPDLFPPLLKPLAVLFPNLMTKTHFGVALKQLFPDYFLRRAYDSYRQNRGFTHKRTQPFFEKFVIPFYVHALKSIKRDFEGIPIMVAWQAVEPGSMQNHRYLIGKMEDDFYNKFFERARVMVSDYINDKWIFLNIHKILSATPRKGIAAHLDNEAHTTVANLLADRIFEEFFASP